MIGFNHALGTSICTSKKKLGGGVLFLFPLHLVGGSQVRFPRSKVAATGWIHVSRGLGVAFQVCFLIRGWGEGMDRDSKPVGGERNAPGRPHGYICTGGGERGSLQLKVRQEYMEEPFSRLEHTGQREHLTEFIHPSIRSSTNLTKRSDQASQANSPSPPGPPSPRPVCWLSPSGPRPFQWHCCRRILTFPRAPAQKWLAPRTKRARRRRCQLSIAFVSLKA